MWTRRVELDGEEHEVVCQSAQGQDLDGEEVGRGDGVPVAPKEVLPGHALAAFRGRSHASFGEQALDGVAAELVAEVPHRPDDAGVAPARFLARHAQNEVARDDRLALCESRAAYTVPNAPEPSTRSIV